MAGEQSMLDVLRKSLKNSDLPFRDFVELVLYHPQFGYYAKAESPVGKDADYVTSPVLSRVFSYSLGKLCREFMSRIGDGVSQVVDIGCGDGGLIRALAWGVGSGEWGVGEKAEGIDTPQTSALARGVGSGGWGVGRRPG